MVIVVEYIRIRDMTRRNGSFDPIVMACHGLELVDKISPLQDSAVRKGKR